MSTPSTSSSTSICFGTDGVRGPAGTFPINDAGAFQIGNGVGAWANQGAPATVYIGWDTRWSSADLAHAAARGVAAAGGNAVLLGVVPTAAVSCAVAADKADAGIMVTASHNPAADNGLKVLVRGGGKPSPEDIQQLERAFSRSTAVAGGSTSPHSTPLQAWFAALPTVDLRGLVLWVDAAHGAAYEAAPAAFSARGATVLLRASTPNGHNINDAVGAVHPPTPDEVAKIGAHLYIGLDGDADRIVLVDPIGGELDGDDILWFTCNSSTAPVVGTVMSNGGLGAALGGRLVRAPVGDANVALAMQEHQAPVGAEPSGHVLFADGLPTGDGVYTALRVLAAIRGDTGRPVLPLTRKDWSRWPVASTSVRFSGPRVALDALTSIRAAENAGNRVVVRYSGTEPLLRILVEGPDTPEGGPTPFASAIAQQFRSLLG